MTIILIVMGVVMTVAAVYLLLRPFTATQLEQTRLQLLEDELRTVEQLIARREMIMQTLRDVEHEYDTNKVSDEDYEIYRKKYERQAAAVMRKLDQIHGGRDWQLRIDEALAERGVQRLLDEDDKLSDEVPTTSKDAASTLENDEAATVPESAPTVADEPQATHEEDSQSGHAANGKSCPHCERMLELDARFCSGCGSPLDETLTLTENPETVTEATG